MNNLCVMTLDFFHVIWTICFSVELYQICQSNRYESEMLRVIPTYALHQTNLSGHSSLNKEGKTRTTAGRTWVIQQVLQIDRFDFSFVCKDFFFFKKNINLYMSYVTSM